MDSQLCSAFMTALAHVQNPKGKCSLEPNYDFRTGTAKWPEHFCVFRREFK
jgi:hypothetical protein